MAITEIIKYQKLDLTLYKLEKDYSQCKEIERVYQCQTMYKARLEALGKLSKELEELYQQLSKLEDRFEEIDGEKDGLKVNFESFSELDEFDEYEKKLAKHEESMININRDASRLIKKISEINAENKKYNEQMDTLNAEYAKAGKILSNKKREMQKSAGPILKQLEIMSANIEEKLLEKYKLLRSAKKMPAFVPYQDGSCLGCGMNIEIEVDKKLEKAGDYAECPHCGRIVYKMA